MASIRVVGDATKGALPSRGWRAIVISLLVKTFATVRSALESLITTRFIAKTDSVRRAKRWAQYGTIVKARLLEKQPNLSTKPKHTAARDQVLAQVQHLKRLFPNQNFWASGLRKGSLRNLAEDVGMLWYHDLVKGLSGRHLRGELAAGRDLVIQGLDLLNEIGKPGIESLLAEAPVQDRRARHPACAVLHPGG